MAEFRLRGLEVVNGNIRQLARRMNANVRPCLVEIVALIQNQSMTYTPIRTGALRASHRSVVGPKLGLPPGMAAVYLTGEIRNRITRKIEPSYSVIVHERPPGYRFRSPWPRGRKYLERAIVDRLNDVRAIIAKWMRRP